MSKGHSEWWITKLRDLGGHLDSYKKKGGIFVGINPMTARGSYASYHFAEFNDAGLTAKNLGHPDSTLLRKDYNGAVTKAQAKEFWAIQPSDCR